MKSFLFHSFVGICFGAFVMVMTCFGIIGLGGAETLDSDIFVKMVWHTCFAVGFLA
ncbi:hypothetical protein [Salibacterium salarium]|uniref:hypothetical protein n=1 Tax=Salibacterium salarium TaxID=284579 RepID=UPI00163AA6EC|nr:hypothetical protein [Salibacterium salarium]